MKSLAKFTHNQLGLELTSLCLQGSHLLSPLQTIPQSPELGEGEALERRGGCHAGLHPGQVHPAPAQIWGQWPEDGQ